MRDEIGLRPQLNKLSLIGPVFARPHQQPERRIAAPEVEIDLCRKQPRRDIFRLPRQRGVELVRRRAEIAGFAHCRGLGNELIDRLAAADCPEQ